MVIVRLARYVLRLAAEAEKNGYDATAYREAFHRLVMALKKLMNGEMSPEELEPLFDFLDKSAMGAKIVMDGGPGSGNHGHKGVPGQRGGSLPKLAAGTIKAAIESGKISTKLDKKKQSKHRKESKKYNDAIAKGDKVSYFTIDDNEIQKIITKNAGTGTGYGRNGQYKEVIDAGRTVAVHATITGRESVTSRITIHYSGSGCHAVPASPKKWKEGNRNE